MPSELDALNVRLQQLEQVNTTLRAQFDTERQHNQRERRRLRVQAGLAFIALVGAIFLSPANRKAIAQGYGVTLANLNARMTAVENKTQFVSVTGGEMYVKGTNLHIENGLPNPGVDGFGSPLAPTLNGKGNLVIGYNALRGSDNDRTGSHNLIVGDQNRYSSYDGVVFGDLNTISAPYAVVTGGASNTASGYAASISAGGSNTASGDASSVSGGQHNTASGFLSSVSGGYSNTASGNSSSISGGQNITQSNNYGWSAGENGGSGTFHSP